MNETRTTPLPGSSPRSPKDAPSSSGEKSSAVWATVLLVLVSLVASLVLLEAGLRFIIGESSAAADKAFHPSLGWIYSPGVYSEKNQVALLAHEIEINSLGLRGKFDLGDWSSADHRIIVLGDSFTFGRAVPENVTFPRVLESILDEGLAPRVSVLNAGVEGYGTAQQLLMLRHLIQSGVTAEFYVLQMFTNDILDNLRLKYESLEPEPYQPGFLVDDDGSLVHAFFPQKPAPARSVEHAGPNDQASELHILQLIRSFQGIAESFVQSRPNLVRLSEQLGLRVSMPRRPGLINAWYDNPELRAHGMLLTRTLVRELANEINELGSCLLIAFVPSPISVYKDTYGLMLQRTFPDDPAVDAFLANPHLARDEIVELANSESIEILDTVPALTKDASLGVYIPREAHLTSTGHRIVGEAIADRIAPRLLSNSCH